MKFKILIDGKNIVRVECPGYATQRFCVKVHAGRITLENVFPNRGGFTRGGAYITASKPKTVASKKSVKRPATEPVRRRPIQFSLQDGVDVWMDTEMRQPSEGQRFGSQGLGGYGDRLFKLDVWQPIPASREVAKNAASRRKTLSRKKENFPLRATITKKKQFDESSMPTATSTPHQKRRKTGLLSETTERKPTQKVYSPSLRVDQTIILGKRNADGLSAKAFSMMTIRPSLVKAETKQRSQDLMTSLNDLGKHQVTTSNGQRHSASLKSLEREQKRLTKKKIEKKMAKKKIEKKMAKKIEEMKMANEKKEKREMLRQKMVKEEKERKMMLRQKMVKEKMAKIAKKIAKEKMAKIAKKMAKEKMAKIAKKMAKEKMAKIAKKMAKEKMAKQMVRKKMEKEKMAKQKMAKQLRDIMKNLNNGKN
ncbi:protein PXR1 [Drosophila yakuba]|uniref:protein PXR1 n=1 Tax=Drosophila yakuba TaxID=7245 RepID=UPI00017DA482|nr:protein PXR1 [Drosophila yakuba]